MKIKIFDFEHEKDLEEAINNFILEDVKVLNILYQASHFYAGNEQVFSFSALIMYEKVEKNL